MPLQLFEAHASLSLLSAIQQRADFGTALEQRLLEGPSRWPEIRLDRDVFIPFLARHLTAESLAETEWQALRFHELYLVCAFGMGDRAARGIFEEEYVVPVARRLSRLGVPADRASDVIQDLRCRLFEMQSPQITRRGYTGRSDLLGWLSLCAVRAAQTLQKRERRERAIDLSESLLPVGERTPEEEALRQRYYDSFLAALEEALRRLTVRQRNLLRHAYFDKLSVDRIASLYQVHRATAARWLANAKEQLIAYTREAFLSRVPMGGQSLLALRSLLHTELQPKLNHLLAAQADPPEEPG